MHSFRRPNYPKLIRLEESVDNKPQQLQSHTISDVHTYKM